MDTRFHADALLTDESVHRLPHTARIRQVIQTGVEIEQAVEAQYLRVGRSFTYGPVRRLFEDYAAEVRDHARILGRHLRDMSDPVGDGQKGRRRRPKAAPGTPILTPPALYGAFSEAFRAAEGAILFHRRAMGQVEDRFLRKFMEILADDHSFHLDILGHLLADIRDRPMHLTPGRKLAPVDVPWVAALFEGVVPPWHREADREDEESAKTQKWYLNYA